MDAHLPNTDYMPNMKKYFIEGGTKFDNHFINTPLCCPARTSILRGQMTHNHNLTDTQPLMVAISSSER
jgi:arylsulfatase A-like enzyme